ncbi:MAG: hypothetical protein HYX54_03720 [Chloroflexi bacterium]|nr:hypothetical protein [Chloroflexota bacterium]
MADAAGPGPGVDAAPVDASPRPAADSSRADPPATEAVPDRARFIQRLLEVVQGTITWGLIVASVALSFRSPEIVAWFVLTFDVYWLYRAVMLTGGVVAAYAMLRRTIDQDWRTRTYALRDVSGRLATIEERLPAMDRRITALIRSGNRIAASGGRREMAQLRAERKELLRLLARRGDPIPDPDRLWHVALVPTHTEPYEKLHETVKALAEADWPRERLMVAIITRETDIQGRENVARLRDTFGDRFLHFFHVLDPLEPGIVVGKSSAMAYGGRWLYRELARLGFNPSEVLVTDLDSDYRVHRGYFGYLSWTFLTDPDRFRRLYQPIPMFHNNMWLTPLPVRLVAIGATHVQMGRSLTPEKLISFSSYSVSLQTVHDVDYWATDAIPEDSRFYWKSFFRFSGEFRSIPLFMPIYGDAVRARSYPRSLLEQYTQIRRWAWGVTDIPYFIRNAFVHSEIPRAVRIRRLLDLWLDHLSWAIAPFVLIFGSNLPLFLNPAFAETTLGQNLPLYATWLLTGAFACLVILMYVEERIAPPRPAEWGIVRNVISRVQWLLLPVVGLIFSNLPALDAQTRLMAGRYLEYRVTEKA